MSDADVIERGADGFIFNHTTQCFVRNVVYDFEKRHGYLFMLDNSCTDMSGALAYFKQIDQGVQRIDTVAGDELDTVYFLSPSSGEWEARSPEAHSVPNLCRPLFGYS